MSFDEIIRWVVSRGLTLIIGFVVVLLLYRAATRAVHQVVPSVLHAQASHLPDGAGPSAEMEKRILTIEDLATRLLRVAMVALLGALVLAVFDLWSILAGIVVIVAAVLFASSDVVLDYVMGFFILVEGPFFKGDWVVVGSSSEIEGTVEEIGLRRTVLRDAMGNMHAVSNGLIRQSSNGTRVFSIATVEVPVLNARELDGAILAATTVSRAMRDDPAWADRFPPDTTTDVWVTGLSIDGAQLRIQQRVPTGMASPVASELRRRLAAALVEASIGTGRWDTPLPITSDAGGPPAG